MLGASILVAPLDAAVEGDRIWMTCMCGAVIGRTLEPAHRQ